MSARRTLTGVPAKAAPTRAAQARTGSRGATPDITAPNTAHAPITRASGCACGGACPRCQASRTTLVHAPDSRVEREADALAERALRTAPATSGSGAASPRTQRPVHLAARDTDAALAAAARGGAPLSDDQRAFFEPRLAHDLGHVRLHTDAAAAAAARGVQAHAYATGRDIVLDSRAVDLASGAGQHLLAHELAHVVQRAPGLARFAWNEEGPDRPPQKDPPPPAWDAAWATRNVRHPDDALAAVESQVGTGLPAMQAASAYGRGKKVAFDAVSLDDLKAIMNPMPPAAGAVSDAAMRAQIDAAVTSSLPGIHEAFRIMQIDTVEAQALYLAHAYAESKRLTQLTEVGADGQSYAPFVGRGPVQVTDTDGYLRALAYMDVQSRRLAATPGHDDEVKLLDEAIAAIKRDITQAANPKYTFLFSAAYMQGSTGVRASGLVGAAPTFPGNAAEDSWMTGRDSSKETWAAVKARADAMKPGVDAAVKAAQAADPVDAKALKAALDAKANVDKTERDMTSVLAGGRQKSGAYDRARRLLSAHATDADNAAAAGMSKDETKPPVAPEAAAKPEDVIR